MRKLATFAAAFSAAVFAWCYGCWTVAAIAAGLCLPGLLLAGKAKDSARLRKRLGLILAGFVLALAWCAFFSQLTLAPWEGRHKEREVFLEAEIEGFPTQTQRGQWSVPAFFTDPATGEAAHGLLYLPEAVEAGLGDRLTVTGTLYLADRVGEEEITYFSAKGLILRVYAAEADPISTPETLPARYWPLEFSQKVRDTLTETLGPERGGLAAALLTGDKSALDGYFLAMSRRAGLAHIIVVSGMHVSILAALVTLLVGRHRKGGAVLTLLLLCGFALVAGGTPSAWRAVILCAAGLAAPLVGRENDPPTSLLTALMLLLLWNPFSAASVSLQLSFAAVAGIEYLAPPLLKKWVPRRPKGASKGRLLLWRGRRTVLQSLVVTLGASLFTTPISAYYFGAVSLVGPVSNLLTLWAVTDAFALSALAALPLFGPAFGLLAVPFLDYLLWSIPKLGALPFASVTLTSDYYAIGFTVLVALIYLNLFWPGKGKRARVPVLCGVVLACACVGLTRLEYARSDLTVAVLDVGQGQSVCLTQDGAAVLVDCGGTVSDAGDLAADYLADLGIHTLDLLVLTHYHADHAGGVPELIKRLDVARIALPDVTPEDPLRQEILQLAQAKGARVDFITANTALPLGEDGTLTLYAPLGDGGANETGLSVLATVGEYDVLLTGDMNSVVERRLVKYGNLPDVELLVVGHHGSKYSTAPELLEAVRPETAVISVGRHNSYGHPAPETLFRLEEAGAAIYRTDLMGPVVIHTMSGK